MTTIVWFREDLRLTDNPALSAAAERGALLPVYIQTEDGTRSVGGATRWWLHHSLQASWQTSAVYRFPGRPGSILVS